MRTSNKFLRWWLLGLSWCIFAWNDLGTFRSCFLNIKTSNWRHLVRLFIVSYPIRTLLLFFYRVELDWVLKLWDEGSRWYLVYLLTRLSQVRILSRFEVLRIKPPVRSISSCLTFIEPFPCMLSSLFFLLRFFFKYIETTRLDLCIGENNNFWLWSWVIVLIILKLAWTFKSPCSKLLSWRWLWISDFYLRRLTLHVFHRNSFLKSFFCLMKLFACSSFINSLKWRGNTW